MRAAALLGLLIFASAAPAALLDDLEARVAACPKAADPANTAPARLRELHKQPPSLARLDQLAATYELLDAFGDAERALREALETRERAAAPAAEIMRTLARIGLMQRAQGAPARAEATLKRCQAVADRASASRSAEAAACGNYLGLAYRDLGRYAEAETELQQVLATRVALSGERHADVGHTHNLLGTLYMLLGDHARAERHYDRSLEARVAALGPCHAVIATSLHYLGDVYDATGRHEAALRARTVSLSLRERVLPAEDHSIGHGQMGLGESLLALRRFDAAEAALRRSLEIHRKVYGPRHQRTLRSVWGLAQLAEARSRPEEAKRLHEAGLGDAAGGETPEFLWRFQAGYARAARANPALAAYFGKQAVNTIQRMRSAASELDRELQRSFVGGKSAVYRELADALIDQGRLREAQQVLAMLKEEEFFEFIRRDAKEDARATRSTFTAGEQPWVKRYAQISGELAALGERRGELERKRRLGMSPADQRELDRVETDAEVARRAFVAFLDELTGEMQKLGAQRRAEVARRDVEGLENYQDDLKELGQGAVMLHYVVMPRQLRIVLTTPEIQIGRTAAIDEASLNRLVHQFREALGHPGSDPLPLARRLYEVLLAPVAEDLRQAKARILMVSLDGTLRYLPLAALHDGKRYAVERWRVSVLAEAARVRFTARGGEAAQFAGLGLTRPVPGFDPLPAVREELEGILKAGMPGEARFDGDFTVQAIRQALARKANLLHLATHFVFTPGTETDSFLLLGNGGRLSLREIREAGFSFRGVDLLTLSACETAVGGGADANGREVEGLGALAQQRGARAVLATLWPVADASTGLLMQRFYRLRVESRMNKAQALQEAQLELLRGEYRHPFFWAPFILMGNWL